MQSLWNTFKNHPFHVQDINITFQNKIGSTSSYSITLVFFWFLSTIDLSLRSGFSSFWACVEIPHKKLGVISANLLSNDDKSSMVCPTMVLPSLLRTDIVAAVFLLIYEITIE